MRISLMQYVLTMGIYIAFLYGFHELCRKHLKWSMIFFFGSLLTFPLWFHHLDGWFRWGKTLLVLVPTCFVNVVRLSNKHKDKGMAIFKKNWVYWVLFAVLFANIAEASMKDLSLGNYFNFITGILLCITIPIPSKTWRVDRKEGFADLVADIPLAWCFIYTTWNACFVYAENPGYLASSMCILIVPEIYSIIKKRSDLWLNARIYTLAVHLLIRATMGDIFTPLMGSASWANEQAVYIWGVLNIIVTVPFAIWWFTKGAKANSKAHSSTKVA